MIYSSETNSKAFNPIGSPDTSMAGTYQGGVLRRLVEYQQSYICIRLLGRYSEVGMFYNPDFTVAICQPFICFHIVDS